MNKFITSQFPFSWMRIRSSESFVLYLAMFVMGGCGLAYEYTLSKVASDILGNSVRQWAIIIGVMMFFMGVGSDLQKYFKNKNLIDKFIAFEILLGLLGAFGPIILLFTYGQYPAHYILAQYFFITAIGLIIGFEIPLITRINETYISELKLNLGAVLKMDYIGALAGSLVWIFVLPKFFTIIESAFVLGLFNVLVGAFTFVFFRKLVTRKKEITLLVAVSLILVSIGFIYSKNWTSHAEQFLYRDRILFSTTTPFQHIVLTESRAGDRACYINGHLQFNSFDEFIYHENLVHPALMLAEHRENILILGGGDGLALREVLKYDDVKKVTLCDIDPQMTRLARSNPFFRKINGNSLNNSRVTLLKNHALVPAGKDTLWIENDNELKQAGAYPVAEINIINMDAASFVEQISGVFDVIIIDFPDPNSPDLSKLYSLQFYENIKRKLAAYGILVQQSTSPVHAREAFLCIGRTMQAAGLTVVPYHDNVPTFGEWGWWVGGRSAKIKSDKIRDKLAQIETIPVVTRYLSKQLICSSLHFGVQQLYSEYSVINTLTNNRVYDFYQQAWQQ